MIPSGSNHSLNFPVLVIHLQKKKKKEKIHISKERQNVYYYENAGSVISFKIKNDIQRIISKPTTTTV